MTNANIRACAPGELSLQQTEAMYSVLARNCGLIALRGVIAINLHSFRALTAAIQAWMKGEPV